jgi:hypothetical protein
MAMRRIRTLTTALAILALGAITAGCAQGNVGLSFGRPMAQPVSSVPAEEPDGDDVADVPWDRCDGECRYRESMRICSTTVQVAGAQRHQAHAMFMQFRDRTAFRARVMQSCAGGGQRFAGHEPAGIRGGLSATDITNLRSISKKVLGPLPGNARGYTAHVTSRIAAPAVGCEKITERHAGGGTFDRWRCPRGTIKRLGW